MTRFLEQTKKEQARRNAAKQGVTHQQTKETAARWRARERDDEAWARELGVGLTYRSLR